MTQSLDQDGQPKKKKHKPSDVPNAGAGRDRGHRVGNYFDALGVRPALGRGFLPEENFGRNAHPVIVNQLSNLAGSVSGDPSIVGKIQISL